MKLLDKEILLLDNHLMAVDKPSLLLTQQDGLRRDSVEARAKAWLKKRFNRPGNVFLSAVHRLDFAASGIVLLARTSKALVRLHEQIRERKWKKKYLVRHEGMLPSKQGVLVNYLMHGNHRAHVVSEVSKFGKIAKLKYQVVENGVASVLLLTGRYHQIRAQLAYIGCPICGDIKYGATNNCDIIGLKENGFVKTKIDLHHTYLEFSHPITKEIVQINSLSPFL